MVHIQAVDSVMTTHVAVLLSLPNDFIHFLDKWSITTGGIFRIGISKT